MKTALLMTDFRVRLRSKGKPAVRGVLWLTLVLSTAGAAAMVSLYAAPQEAPPTFEVASIKRDLTGERGGMFTLVPACHLERMTLRDLVIFAYQVHDFQVIGGPGWIDSDRYNVDAKAERPPALNQEWVNLQYRRLQALLHDRFNLTVHRETKELPVYELTVAKGGPKLQRPTCIARELGDRTIAPGEKPEDYCGLMGGGRTGIDASSSTMARFADFLARPLGRTVIDKTGISGEFQIHITYAMDTPTVPSPDGAGPRPSDSAAATDLRPDVFTALQQQLGLKLESAKGPVQVLIIDHVEKPSEN